VSLCRTVENVYKAHCVVT